MAWRGYGSDLYLVVQEGNVHTECSLRTMEADVLTDFDFRGCPVRSKLTINSDSLREAFGELDWSSAYVSILISEDAPYFRISTTGTAGSCQIEYSKDSDMFENFEVQGSQHHSYKLAMLQPCIKALHGASKTQLKMNEVGVLALQHLIKAADGTTSIVDFLFIPSLDNPDEYEPMNLDD